MRIVELLIDDIDGGVDGIALVEQPAHESTWLMFKQENPYFYVNELGEEKARELAFLLGELAQTEEELLALGYEILEVKEIDEKMRQEFAQGRVDVSVSTEYGDVRIISDPNNTDGDPLGGDLIRYKYVGPRDSKNRDFCRIMLEQNRVFRKEDILQMENATANPQFGNYSIWEYRGSYNCRHRFVQVTYRPKEGERILNDAAVRRGRIGQEEIPQVPTITTVTANAAERNYLIEQLNRAARKGIYVLPELPLELTDTVTLKIIAEGLGISYTQLSKISGKVEKTLQAACDDFNKNYKNKAGYAMKVKTLMEVYSRGLRAYNRSKASLFGQNSPNQFAMGRVKAFVYLMIEGKPQHKAYTMDYDLLPEEHPITKMRNKFSVIDVIDNVPVFSNRQDAEKMALMLGCEGSHSMMIGNREVFMPCFQHEFASYDDYPQAASENACKVLRWIDEHGRDEVSGMELSGLARANQLCKKEPLSEDTIARMAAFERHRENSKISPEFEGTPWKDKGYVAWLAWGGDEGIAYAQRKLEQIREEMDIDVSALSPYVDQSGTTISESDFLYENPCQSGYIAYGTKMKNGRRVPNCVKMSKGKFSYDDDKMELTGAAMIPNKFIMRRDQNGFYYVYFREDIIKQLAERFLKQMKNGEVLNIEHTPKKADDSFITESWIVEDPSNDKSAALGLEYPKGTWVITVKIENPELWKQVKEGKYKGFSVEGYFLEKLIFKNIK
jgi:hypothetical protein